MYAAGRQCDDNVASFHGFVVQDFIFVNNAYCKTSQIVFVFGIETGHFCCFTADESSTGLYTAFCYAGNNGCYFFREVFAYGNIVQEEQRFCAAANDVVDTHSHTVDTYCVMFVHQKRQFQFCANTVSTAYQYGFCDACQIHFKQTAKTTDIGHCPCCYGSCNVFFHQFHCLIPSGNIHTCSFIAFTLTFHDCCSFRSACLQICSCTFLWELLWDNSHQSRRHNIRSPWECPRACPNGPDSDSRCCPHR